MSAEAFLKQGDVDGALQALQQEVRAKPADAKLRVFLFQLLAVRGEWDRALNQLNVSAEMDPKTLLMAQVCRPAIECELFRAEVFAGKRAPLLLGEPDQWVGMMIHANQMDAQGQHGPAAELRSQALELAPAVPGTLTLGSDKEQTTQPFEWLADADSRLGPMLEAIIDGRYYWVPMHRLSEVTLDAPSDLRDMVWLPGRVRLTNGGDKIALFPVRYPGTESSTDGSLRLARKTDYRQPTGAGAVSGTYFGLGQRELATDADTYPMLRIRRMQFAPA